MVAACLQRWAVRLSAYSYTIEFRCTSKRCNGDGLSRLPLNNIYSEGLTSEPAIFKFSLLDKLASATCTNKLLSMVYRYTTKGWPD